MSICICEHDRVSHKFKERDIKTEEGIISVWDVKCKACDCETFKRKK